MLEFDSERDALWPVAVYVHPPEIWSITPSASDPSAFITVHNTGKSGSSHPTPSQSFAPAPLLRSRHLERSLQLIASLVSCQSVGESSR